MLLLYAGELYRLLGASSLNVSMSYGNLSSVSQNALKFYQQFTGEERGGFLSFLVGTGNSCPNFFVEGVCNDEGYIC
jgi:hypothetical protein